MISGITISRGGSEHLTVIRSMLAANDLPHEDVAAHVENFLLAWSGPDLVGTVGIELLGSDGLLRSLCVAPRFRNRGLAAKLSRSAEALARNEGVRRLYLLTTTARSYFERAGYTPCERESVPESVRGTTEFSLLCPHTATCMVRHLGSDAQYFSRDLLALRDYLPGSRMWAVGLSLATLTYFEVEPGARFESHLHEGEQITTVVDGALFFEVGGEIVRVGVGEAIAIPSRVPHAVFAGPDGARAFDAWAPAEHLLREEGFVPPEVDVYDTLEVPYES